jgi:hypothetical protein
LQNSGLPFTLQVEKLIESNKIMKNKMFEIVGKNFWKPNLFEFRKNRFKKRRSKLFEFQNKAECEKLFKKRKTKFKMLNFFKQTEMKDVKTVYLEMEDVVQFINYCKVCGNVKIKSLKSAIHMLWSLIQIDKYNPRGWEFLISLSKKEASNSIYFSSKLEKPLDVGSIFERRWKFKEEKPLDVGSIFERRWKFKEDFTMRKRWKFNNFWKFKFDVLRKKCLNLTSSEEIDEIISTAQEEQ